MLRDKVWKLERLAQDGATEGEREAAKHALNRLRERYGDELDALLGQAELPVSDHFFRYKSNIEKEVLRHVILHMDLDAYTVTRSRKIKKLACVTDEPTAMIVEELYEYHCKKLERMVYLFVNGYLFEAMPPPESRTSKGGGDLSRDEREALMAG